ncbi:hypothetical protein C5Y96_00105 [Blastopirellula marina]|uniref:Uncharacterized protein n=1 Tax=Blastopirellula marina TaxID=124 RepID=A0A2S8GC16_9BACT|nr:hypothetical protein C5Y96_00105 [Blastopirellula marina]RCS56363.1 hypothetical protein DTL36_00105 [Bremerella cremea]
MILVTALVAIVLSHAMTSRQLMVVEEDARRAYAAAGMFHIPNDERVYVRSISQPLLHVWQWRIQVPPGKSYLVCLSEVVPRDGYPPESWPLELMPGDNLLNIQLVRSELGTWKALRFIDWKQDDQQQNAQRRFDSRELNFEGAKWLEVGKYGFPPITNPNVPWLGDVDGKAVTFPHSVLPADLTCEAPLDEQQFQLFRLVDLQRPTPDNQGNEGLLIWIEEVKGAVQP